MANRGSSVENYFVKVLNGMAHGLFASLLIGLIIKQIGTYAGIPQLVVFGNIAQKLMGPAIGVGVAYSVGAPPLGVFAAAVTGAIGANSIIFDGATAIIQTGEPVGAFVAALVGAEISKLVGGKTKFDIILVPLTSIVVGGMTGYYISPYIAAMMNGLGAFINRLTELHPIPMGITVSVVMGIILTLPISSAALAMALNLSGLAAGAATVGCAANMIGFAVASYRENKMGGLIAQGLGTSMLQIPNIIRNPRIWIPAIVASAILGPISTAVLKLESSAIGAGMGTSGLVGQIAMIETMGASTYVITSIILMHFILPGIIAFVVSEWMRKKRWIKKGDMQL
ncbi:PTS sugar transporter subunit IIC [Soehngenia saccharolytica]|nr:PTS sugar transporter subunit IIC [Soehngenia saccharolytica]